VYFILFGQVVKFIIDKVIDKFKSMSKYLLNLPKLNWSKIIGLDALGAMIDRAITIVATKWQSLIDGLPIPDFLLSADTSGNESTDAVGLGAVVRPLSEIIGSQAARNLSSTQGAVNNTNIVINVSGAASPGRTADIIKRELSLAQSQQVNSPGLNAAVVN